MVALFNDFLSGFVNVLGSLVEKIGELLSNPLYTFIVLPVLALGLTLLAVCTLVGVCRGR